MDTDKHGRPQRGNGACAPDPEHEPASAALRQAGQLAREVAEYASHFVTARLDKLLASLRNAGMYAALGVIGLAVVVAVMVTATVLFLVGLGGATSALFDAAPWVGQLIVGLAVLGLTGLAALFGVVYVTRQSRRKTVRKYEQRRQQQRIDFGRDIHQRAQNAGK